MQNSVLEMVYYLVDYFVFFKKKNSFSNKEIRSELQTAGFKKEIIDNTISWVNNFKYLKVDDFEKTKSIRIYTDSEQQKITIEGRAFLLKLEELDIINVFARETIIHNIMKLAENRISLNDIKWIVLLAIFDKPESLAASVWLQKQINNNQSNH